MKSDFDAYLPDDFREDRETTADRSGSGLTGSPTQDMSDLPEDEGAELYEHFHWTVDKGQALLRIDKYLTTKIEHVSRTKVQAAADAGNIRVNGQPVKANYKVKPLDDIAVLMPYPPRDHELVPEDIPLDIVYEDDSLLVVNKPAGMVVHPAHGNYTGTLVNALAWYLRDLPLFRSGEMRPGLVHRIDKDTSGLLVIAKTEYALSNLARQFFEKTTDRRYYAIAWGSVPDEGTIVGYIGRNPKDRKQMAVFSDGSQGKEAVTHYRVLERFEYVTLVECKLETGRTHQIRVHFKHIGHPLFGDTLYGGDEVLRGTLFSKYKQFVQNCFEILPRQALHAKTLAFTHPQTGQRMAFDSALPQDMEDVLSKWHAYTASRHV